MAATAEDLIRHRSFALPPENGCRESAAADTQSQIPAPGLAEAKVDLRGLP